MQVVFDTKTFAPAQRREAWREAICEIYLQVDCVAEKQNDYAGFVREARFGAVTLTDTLFLAAVGSPPERIISRISIRISTTSESSTSDGLDIHQAGSSFLLRPESASLYYAERALPLRCNVKSRQFWVELPREAFDRRFDSGGRRCSRTIDLGRGSGPHSRRFLRHARARGRRTRRPCRGRSSASTSWIFWRWRYGEPAATGGRKERATRPFAVRSRPNRNRIWATPTCRWRRSPRQNGISLRYLHQLFRLTDMSVSEWLRLRRLQRCRRPAGVAAKRRRSRSPKSLIPWASAAHPISAICFALNSMSDHPMSEAPPSRRTPHILSYLRADGARSSIDHIMTGGQCSRGMAATVGHCFRR